MNQALYAHMNNKRKKINKIKINFTLLTLLKKKRRRKCEIYI
jgi:hypothetical protein